MLSVTIKGRKTSERFSQKVQDSNEKLHFSLRHMALKRQSSFNETLFCIIAMTEDGSFSLIPLTLIIFADAVSQTQQRRRDEGCRASLDYAQAVYTAGGGAYP